MSATAETSAPSELLVGVWSGSAEWEWVVSRSGTSPLVVTPAVSLCPPACLPVCRAGDADGEVARLRAEAAARAAELREAKQAEAAVTAECERLERELVTERLRTNVG